jgi:STE24 endopeptidase
LLVPWDWVPGGTLTPARAADVFTPEQLVRAESYSSTVRALSNASYAVSLAVAAVLGFTRLGSALADRLRRRLPGWAVVPAVVLVILLLGRLLTTPFALLVRERRLAEGLTTQGLAGWVTDRLLSLSVSWVATTLLVGLVVVVARRRPRRWFMLAGPGAAALVFAGSLLYPVAVEPLFNRFTPLADGPLRTAVLEVAAREDVAVDEVLVADASRRTTTLNAYVSGFGATRRVVVYDNLVNEVPLPEARSVVAHELAHARNRDVLLGTALGAVGAFAAVCLLALVTDAAWVRRRAGVRGAGDPRAAALLAALLAWGGLFAAPLQNVVSRAVEARADRTALAATSDPAAFVAVQQQLALASLADPTPPAWSQLWFGSHPTVLQRIGLPASLARAEAAASSPRKEGVASAARTDEAASPARYDDPASPARNDDAASP